MDEAAAREGSFDRSSSQQGQQSYGNEKIAGGPPVSAESADDNVIEGDFTPINDRHSGKSAPAPEEVIAKGEKKKKAMRVAGAVVTGATALFAPNALPVVAPAVGIGEGLANNAIDNDTAKKTGGPPVRSTVEYSGDAAQMAGQVSNNDAVKRGVKAASRYYKTKNNRPPVPG